jgi:hypothetical protein
MPNIAWIQILRYRHEIWYVYSCVYIIQYFNVNIHISGILTIYQAAIAFPGNIYSFHIHDFQGLIIHEIFNWTFDKLL